MPLAWSCLIGGGSVATATLSAKHATREMLNNLTSRAETSDNVSLLRHNMVGPPMTFQEVHKKSGRVPFGFQFLQKSGCQTRWHFNFFLILEAIPPVRKLGTGSLL